MIEPWSITSTLNRRSLAASESRILLTRPGSRSANSRTSIAAEKTLAGVALFSIRCRITDEALPAQRRVDVELRIEHAADLVEVQQRLAEQREIGRKLQAVLGCRCATSPASRGRRSSRACVSAMKAADQIARSARRISDSLKSSRRSPSEHQDVRGIVAAPLANREYQLEQLLLQGRRDAARPSRDRCSAMPAIGRQQDVARVRIGVEHAVDQDLLQVGAEQFFGERRAVAPPSIRRG